MAKWFDKWMFGNPNKPDFTVKDLPKTRFDLFIDVIKIRFLGLVSVNLLYCLFLLPLIIFSLFFVLTVTNEIANMQINEPIKVLQYTLEYLDFYLLVFIPLYTLAGPAKAGMHYVIRNWAWGEHATIRQGFWKEFKRSWKKAMLLNFITSLVLYTASWWVMFLFTPENVQKYPVFPYLGALVAFGLLIYLVASFYSFPQLVTYELKVRKILKNSFIYFIVQLPQAFLVLVSFLLMIIIGYFFRGILLVLFISMGLSFIALAKTIYCNFVFDKFVNKDDTFKRRGMAPQVKEKTK